MPSPLYKRLRPWAGLTLTLALGCASATTSNTARTSTEQLLVANAVDQSLDKVNFTSFNDTNVYLQEKYVDCVDKNYVIASTRHRLLSAGARIVDAPEKADVVVEIRTGAVGTTSANAFVGTPEVSLPGMLTIPEVKLMERRKQQAVAKLGLVAYDPKTSEIYGSGGTSLSRSNDNNWFFAGVGPYQSGSVKKEVSDSTTGPAAKPQTHIPTTVAFTRPVRAVDTETQMATEEPAKSEISPAAHAEESSPDWAKTRR
ncbi:DUF6655 family protein [Planctomicrobium piriforme]|uniref:Uncharacterized protein n=1 Tax=Planctomicrobium piriforme TaxID=1576369 RepID=A0A1I3THI1_9PLAN|nr:DUF6655 family protein [Planctomicrobium piriforme]SFJ69899.1 hypothetical protein SAMN05421753_13016 [Planctomicrobium piriforme]